MLQISFASFYPTNILVLVITLNSFSHSFKKNLKHKPKNVLYLLVNDNITSNHPSINSKLKKNTQKL